MPKKEDKKKDVSSEKALQNTKLRHEEIVKYVPPPESDEHDSNDEPDGVSDLLNSMEELKTPKHRFYPHAELINIRKAHFSSNPDESGA